MSLVPPKAVKKLITGNEAVALGALRAGVRVATGYPGTPATGVLASLLEMSLPGRHVEWSVNEKVALEVAAGAAWAGQRALCTMKMSGVNVAYDSLCSIAYSGTVGGLVIYVADDPGASAGMVEQDSRGFARMSDLPVLEPASVAEAYRLAEAAFELSERCGAPVFLRTVAAIANSYAPVEIEDPLPPADRPAVLARDIEKYTKAGAAICTAQHRAAIGRLQKSAQVIAEMGLNRLYLAPRAAHYEESGRLLRNVPPPAPPEPVGPRPGGEPDVARASGQAAALVLQTQETLRSIRGYLPGALQELLRRVDEAVRAIQQTRHAQDAARQAHDIALQAEENLAQLEEIVPHLNQPIEEARDLLRLARQHLAIVVAQSAPAGEERPVQQPAAAAAAVPAHPLRREGLGIIAVGVASAYVDEALALIGNAATDGQGVFEGWPDFGPRSVSVLRVTSSVPFPEVQVQALLRHCSVIVVLEELEPYAEKDLYIIARNTDWDGRIIGKLNGVFGRSGEYGVNQVLRGVAFALDCPLPPGLLPADHGPGSAALAAAEALAAARPITVCAGCPHRGTFMAINEALRKLRYKPGEVMVTGDIGCTILGMNPPFNTVWNEVAMGASIPLAQGFVHAGVEKPVIATIGDSTFFHAGIPGLINAIHHNVPLTAIILDNGWTAMTGMQVNPGTCPDCQEDSARRVDIAGLISALGVDHFREIDPFDLPAATDVIREALGLPGVKVILARRECAIQAMRRGLRAGQVHVVPEKCNLCKLCIAQTGCPAIRIEGETIGIDESLCYGCGLCVETCKRDAITRD